jgi:hypothetical protein
MERHHGLWRIAEVATAAMRLLDPLRMLDVPDIKRELTVWEFAILKSIWCQPGLWPDSHPDTQKLQRLGLVASRSGDLVLTRKGIEFLRSTGASRRGSRQP